MGTKKISVITNDVKLVQMAFCHGCIFAYSLFLANISPQKRAPHFIISNLGCVQRSSFLQERMSSKAILKLHLEPVLPRKLQLEEVLLKKAFFTILCAIRFLHIVGVAFLAQGASKWSSFMWSCMMKILCRPVRTRICFHFPPKLQAARRNSSLKTSPTSPWIRLSSASRSGGR